MNCAEFLSWLDTHSGSPRRAAYAHAASCTRCAQHLAAAHRVDELLVAPLPPAPAGLASQVLQRVRASGAPALPPAAAEFVPAGFRWREFLSEPAILFSGIAACMGLAFALLAALPATAVHVRPGWAALRQLSENGAQALSGMISRPDGMPLMLFACAALASTAWFATRAAGLRTR